MRPEEATKIKLKAQRESIVNDSTVESDAVSENGNTLYYNYRKGINYLTIEVVDNPVDNSKMLTG